LRLGELRATLAFEATPLAMPLTATPRAATPRAATLRAATLRAATPLAATPRAASGVLGLELRTGEGFRAS
jgi:hypothetical protein